MVRHMIYAQDSHRLRRKNPSGVREAIEQRQWPIVDQYMTVSPGAHFL